MNEYSIDFAPGTNIGVNTKQMARRAIGRKPTRQMISKTIARIAARPQEVVEDFVDREVNKKPKLSKEEKINLNHLAQEIANREGKIIPVGIGQISEILRITLDILAEKYSGNPAIIDELLQRRMKKLGISLKDSE